jgi:hypothetical protein
MLAHVLKWTVSGTFQTKSAGTEHISAMEPVPPKSVVVAMTLSPFLNLDDDDSRIIPERSSPGIYGNGGRTWDVESSYWYTKNIFEL